MRFIDEFSADILAADREWRTPPLPSAEPRTYGHLPVLLRGWLDARIAAGQPLPAWRGKTSTTAIAEALGRNRISLARYRHLIDEAAAIVGTAPQTVSDQPVRGRLDGQPWIAVILADHTERDSLAALARLLQDACYLVLAFLSGARDSEIKHLARGGLTTECDADGTPYRWKMHSLAFKAEDDPAGAPATWNIGEPAARAIAVLERLQPPGAEFLFARLEHSPGSKPNAVSQVLTSGATNARLNAFAAWVNDYCQRHRRADGIPLVGNQPWHLTNSQFRRTLAWFIARRPGGVIAGALAYRHHCVQVFEGYAGTSESGFGAEGGKRAGPRPRRAPHGRDRRPRAHPPHRPRSRRSRPPPGDLRRTRPLPGQRRPGRGPAAAAHGQARPGRLSRRVHHLRPRPRQGPV